MSTLVGVWGGCGRVPGGILRSGAIAHIKLTSCRSGVRTCFSKTHAVTPVTCQEPCCRRFGWASGSFRSFPLAPAPVPRAVVAVGAAGGPVATVGPRLPGSAPAGPPLRPPLPGRLCQAAPVGPRLSGRQAAGVALAFLRDPRDPHGLPGGLDAPCAAVHRQPLQAVADRAVPGAGGGRTYAAARWRGAAPASRAVTDAVMRPPPDGAPARNGPWVLGYRRRRGRRQERRSERRGSA